MSTKRTSDEFGNTNPAEGQTNNGGAADVPQDDNAKRTKLTPFISDTTLQDLPIELIESILIKVVAMEVKSMKLSKRVWTEKAELVINRLEDVCSEWSNVLSTDVFRTRLERALEAVGAIRLDVLQRYTMQSRVSGVTALGGEVFLFRRRHYDHNKINVYDRNNMTVVKDVIPLPGLSPESIVACAVSNCVYILNGKLYNHFSIVRITKDSDNRWSTVSELIRELNLPRGCFCVAANGSLIIARQQTKTLPAIRVFDANGSLQQKLWLPSDIAEISEIVSKPNGNLVLRGLTEDSVGNNNDDDDDDDNNDNNNDNNDINDNNDDNDNGHYRQDKLTEIDMNGNKIRQHLCPLGGGSILGLQLISVVDNDGRMMTVSERNGLQLLDSEFNPMDFTGPLKLDLDPSTYTYVLFHYNSETNETIVIDEDLLANRGAFTLFQLKEL